jgi:MYXO-CTERM domain-containing protein
MAFLVLVLSEDVLDDDVMAEIDGVRTTFEADWEEDVQGLADLDTTLGENTAPVWGEEPGDSDTAGDTDAADTGASAADTEDPPCCKEDAGGCGCTTPGAPHGGLALGAFAVAGALAARRRAAAVRA